MENLELIRRLGIKCSSCLVCVAAWAPNVIAKLSQILRRKGKRKSNALDNGRVRASGKIRVCGNGSFLRCSVLSHLGLKLARVSLKWIELKREKTTKASPPLHVLKPDSPCCLRAVCVLPWPLPSPWCLNSTVQALIQGLVFHRKYERQHRRFALPFYLPLHLGICIQWILSHLRLTQWLLLEQERDEEYDSESLSRRLQATAPHCS